MPRKKEPSVTKEQVVKLVETMTVPEVLEVMQRCLDRLGQLSSKATESKDYQMFFLGG